MANMTATTDEQNHAAEVIQRNYRGYRERRQLQGMGLDASARWTEVRRTVFIKNKQTYRKMYGWMSKNVRVWLIMCPGNT